PQGLIPEDAYIRPTSAEGPSGWTASLRDVPPSVEFLAPAGSGIQPGQAATFTVTGDVGRLAADECSEWTIRVSSDGFDSTAIAEAAASGATTTCIRVLEATGLALVAPAGAADGTVTAGQSNACARLTLRNEGTADLVVLPRPEGNGVGVGLARAAADPPCTGSELAEGKAPMASGETRSFDFRLSFGDAASTLLYGRATASGATAVERALPLTIQPQASLTYVNGTLIPRSVQPRTPGAVFRFTATKGPAGSPAISLDPAATTFSFAACPPQPLISQPGVGPGQSPNVVLEFDACDIEPVQDGRYDTAVRYRYTDANGFTSETQLAGVDRVRIDGTPPQVDLSLTLPTPACCVPPEKRAVKDGDRVTLTGKVRDPDPDSGQTQACPGCLVQGEIRQYQDAGCELAGAPAIATTPANQGGDLGAVYQGSYHVTTAGIRWVVSARDDAGNLRVASSDCVEVDNLRPLLAKAETARVGAEQNRVKVTVEECVGGTSNPLDWRIEGNLVVEVESITCAIVGGVPRGAITLRTILPFPDDAPLGRVRYEPLPLVGGRVFDRVNNTMSAQDVPLEDGISRRIVGL
ncbi:MAG TPA: hypothetical protein VM638_07840, partial [Actinomycetota bacterium]|nr:hypothetical protein [Actinomycetota bacterium]